MYRLGQFVEGSVECSGDRVRITVQLIHAPTDRHLWAENYQRDLRDVLALQSEVAKASTNEIKMFPTRCHPIIPRFAEGKGIGVDATPAGGGRWRRAQLFGSTLLIRQQSWQYALQRARPTMAARLDSLSRRRGSALPPAAHALGHGLLTY